MSTEDRLHRLMSTVGAGDVDSGSWSRFVAVAHRDRIRHRILTATAGVTAIVLVALGTSAVLNLERTDRDTPPSDRNIVPVPIPEDVPTDCPTAPEFTEGPLGTVAFLGATELHVVDVATGEDSILVKGGEGFGEGFFAGEVKISPDGQWVSFGEGLMVPTAGGDVCAPLGERVVDLQWTLEGGVVALRRGRFVIGDPGEETIAIEFEGKLPEFRSMVLSPDGIRAAVAAFEDDKTAIWVIDLRAHEDVARLTSISPGDLAEIELAEWDPEGRWVLYWTKFPNSESLDADGSPLNALDTTTGQVVTVTEAMISERDQMTWCGGRLVFTDGGGRQIMFDEKIITSAASPDWETIGLHPSDYSGSYVDPACDGTGSGLATVRAFTDGVGLSSLILWSEGTNDRTEMRPSGQESVWGYAHPELSEDGSTVVVEVLGPNPGSGGNEIVAFSGTNRLTLGILGSPSPYFHVSGSPDWDWHRP